MAVRRGEHVDYTVADAMVDRHLPSLAAYLKARQAVAQDVRELTGQSAVVNAADDPDRGAVYLTVIGTSAESGDDGQAGRGNRSTGLITPGRPMTMESVAGKNPVSHVGKIYNVMAGRIAAEAAGSIDGLRGLECLLVSRIGAPVSEPQLVHGRCWLERGCDVRDVEQELERVVSTQLEGLDALCDDFVEGRIRVA
jgi:S-adenosylmethionine synthetase